MSHEQVVTVGAAERRGVQVTDLLSMLRRYWWPIILLPLIAVDLAFALQPAKSYTATDTIQILPVGGPQNISAGTLSVLVPGVVNHMHAPDFADHAAAAAQLPASVAKAPVSVVVSGDPTTGLVTITAKSPYAYPVTAWANAYSNYAITQKGAVDPQNLTTINQVSSTPATAKSDSTKIVAVGAGLLGLVVGVLVSIGIGFLRADRTDPEKIRRRFGTDVVVRMPPVRNRSRVRANGSLLSESRAIHELGLRLRLSGVTAGRGADERFETPSRVIAVLSEKRGEGRTEVANALAWEMTRSGQSVAVIHVGLQRRPTTAQANGSGPSGAKAKEPFHLDLSDDEMHPAEVVLSRLPQVIKKLSATHDLVLVDGPPMSAGADAQVVAVLAGAVLWVSGRHVDRNELRCRLAEFDQHGVDLLGLVINQPPRRFFRKRGGSVRPSTRVNSDGTGHGAGTGSYPQAQANPSPSGVPDAETSAARGV
jgi:Mrp family chromosome partitioning ATPase/capsular polysaccharide biosynthesis protein